MTQIYANNFTTIVLGRRGENLARKVVFDIRDLESLYGTGDVEVIYQRPCDAQPYPLTVQREGTIVTWDVTSTDTEMSDGSGKCELRYYVGETLAKSKTWRTWVEPAMGTPSETTPPEPEKGWVDKVLEAGAAAEEAAMAAQDAQAKAEEASKAFDEALDEAERAAEAEANRNVWEVYDDEKAYQTMNKVSWNGASYLCKQPCQGIAPDDTDYWLLIADKGRDGIVEDGSGLYGFHIDDNGCLILTYEGDTPPDFVINEQGELIANLDGNKTLNIGRVRVEGSEAVFNQPKIGENGNWYVWDADAGAYTDTGVAASGGGGGGVTDVQVAGNSAVSDGVAIIPRASSSEYGVIKPITVYATEVNNNGALIASVRTAENYDSLPSAGFISKGTLENINNRLVKAAMCDGKGPAWTAEEQAAARDRMGIPGDYQLIEEIVLEETVSEISRNICPDGEAYQFEHFAVKLDIPAVESGVITQRTFGMDVNGKRIFWLNNVVAETGCYSFTFFVTSLHGMCVAFCVGGTVSNNYAAWNIYPPRSYFHLFSLPVTDFKLYYGTFPAGTNVKIYGVEA